MRQEWGFLTLKLTAVLNLTTYSADNKRRTRYAQKTLNPEWNQTVIYKNIHLEQVLLIEIHTDARTHTRKHTLAHLFIGVHNIFCTIIKHTHCPFFLTLLPLICEGGDTN